ncbi:MAG: chemotaxis protein CheA [Verrucomicrobiota bacterium]
MAQPNPLQTFHDEAEDLLVQIEEIALEVDTGAPDAEAINRLFRAFHTIKGSGAMFGFDAVAGFTHHVETVLDKVREGVLRVSSELIDLILAARDHIRTLFAAQDSHASPDLENGARIIRELNALLPEHAVAAGDARAMTSRPTETAVRTGGQAQTFAIHFRPPLNLMSSGTNPALLLNELRALGQATVVADLNQVPALSALQPDQCYFAWDITLTTTSGLNAVKDIFIFVEDGSDLRIVPLDQPAAAADVGTTRPGPSTANLEPALVASSAKRKTNGNDRSVRVPSERLDRLVALVGEMVINQARLSQVAAAAAVPNLSAPVEELERLVAELRDNVLGIRMMPIGTTFTRFKRLVHDLSAELGKEIDLATEGAETELDKTVLDQLADPLVHLIRNSVDHGVEPASERLSKGKPRRGTIRLAAAHTGSSVVVTIQDDGRGLDPARLRSKAIEKKLISPEAVLSEKEIYNLIFLPGFSTAPQVTNVSGRGVGMDVVKRQIDALRGTVALSSRVGAETTVALTLPLTLAIIDGLLVEVNHDPFIIPMAVVTENVELPRSDRFRNNGRNVIPVRGELVPYVRLRELFNLPDGDLDIEKIVIVRHEDQRLGLVVDRVIGSHQTVIQSLGRFYRNIQLCSGSTIMGDGRVALILDMAGLTRFADGHAPGSNRNRRRRSPEEEVQTVVHT